MTAYRVTELREPEPAIVEAVSRLLPQLSRRAPEPDAELLRHIADAPDIHLLLAVHRLAATYDGMLTLVVARLMSGVRARIEDLVVDKPARGRGAGRALVQEAVRVAQAASARDVDLTSQPQRVEAIALYESVGFVRRRTGVYRLTLT